MQTRIAVASILIVFVVIFTPFATAQTESGADLAGKLRNLKSRVLPTDGEPGKAVQYMLHNDGRDRLYEANKRETRAWRNIKSRGEWEKYRQPRLQALRQSLGKFPPAPESIKVIVTKTMRGKDYQIKNIVFESRPGLLVTANLYLPRGDAKSMPGILICHSHHRPKEQGELQDMGVNWARHRCAVLVMDQVGHGERRQHPFVNAKSYPKEFRVSRQDYHFRYDTALQLHLVGESLMGWMVWDLMRGVDVLLQQPNIDRERIILLGAVAGGGDPCAVTAALDPRIKAAAPFNFGGPQPETRHPLPPDAEDRFNYAGSGSWESTRNLRLSARDGFLPWLIVGAVAPRRLIYGHEFAWDRERDAVWTRLQKINQWYKHPDYLSSVKGRGSVRGRPPEATHCTNIGRMHRAQIYPALQKWFNMPSPTPEVSAQRETAELLCLTSKLQPKNKKVHELARELAASQIAGIRKQLAKQSPQKQRATLRKSWSELLGGVSRPKAKLLHKESRHINSVEVQRIVIKTDRAIRVPMLLLKPAAKINGNLPVVVAIAQQGKEGFLKHRAETIAALLQKKIAVCLPDLRGTGETAPGKDRGRRSWITSISATELMLGTTIRGGQCRDLLAVLDYLRKQPRIDANKIALWGDTFAAVNAPNRNLAVPREVDNYPAQTEPMGCTVVLLTALFDGRVCAVQARGGLVSWRSILDSPFCYVPHDEAIPDLFAAGDMADLVGALAPLPVRFDNPRDGQNRRVTIKTAETKLAPARNNYQRANAARSLAIDNGVEDSADAAAWFLPKFK